MHKLIIKYIYCNRNLLLKYLYELMSQCIEKFSDQIQRKHIITVSSFRVSMILKRNLVIIYCLLIMNRVIQITILSQYSNTKAYA